MILNKIEIHDLIKEHEKANGVKFDPITKSHIHQMIDAACKVAGTKIIEETVEYAAAHADGDMDKEGAIANAKKHFFV